MEKNPAMEIQVEGVLQGHKLHSESKDSSVFLSKSDCDLGEVNPSYTAWEDKTPCFTHGFSSFLVPLLVTIHGKCEIVFMSTFTI